MKPAYTLIILFTLLISACAPMGSSIVIEDKTMTNNHPPFSLRFAEKPIAIKGKGKFREFQFIDDSKFIIAGYNSWIKPANLDYYYSLSSIVSNANFLYIGSVHFADHEWAKVAKYDKQHEALLCGYLTRKDNSIILVLSAIKGIERNSKLAFEEYINTHEMSDSIRKEIDSQIEYLDNMVEILYWKKELKHLFLKHFNACPEKV